MRFTDCYAEQSCTAGRASFITGQCGYRTGLTKVGLPGAERQKPASFTIDQALQKMAETGGGAGH